MKIFFFLHIDRNPLIRECSSSSFRLMQIDVYIDVNLPPIHSLLLPPKLRYNSFPYTLTYFFIYSSSYLLILFFLLNTDVIFPSIHSCYSFSFTMMLFYIVVVLLPVHWCYLSCCTFMSFFLLYTDVILPPIHWCHFSIVHLLYIDVLFLLYINIIFIDVIFSFYTLTVFFLLYIDIFFLLYIGGFCTQISLHINVNSLIYWCYTSYVPYVVIILPPIHLSRFELDEGF